MSYQDVCPHLTTKVLFDLTYCATCGKSLFWTCPEPNCGKRFDPRVKVTSAHRVWHRRKEKEAQTRFEMGLAESIRRGN